MAVITLAGNTIGCCIGTGSFEGVGTAFSSAKQSVKSLAQGISTLKSKIDTARVAANVDTSHTQAQNAEKREETKQGALTTGYDKLENLISDVGTVDNKAADKIRERKNDFYAQYSYLKPECEKSTKEKIKDKWEGVKSWCKEHWKEIVATLAIVVGAVIAIVAVIASGGMALVPILTTLLTSIGLSAGTAMTVATVASLTIAVVAILSTIGSSTLNVIDTWGDIDNPTFNKWQKALNVTSFVSNGLYSIGSIYNGVKGITNANLRNYGKSWITNPEFRSAVSGASKYSYNLQPNTATFWSGLGDVGADGSPLYNGDKIAANCAEKMGRTSLEKTLEVEGITLPDWNPDPNVINAWNSASSSFAMQAAGDVRGLMGNVVRDKSVWNVFEKTILGINPKVTSLTIYTPSSVTTINSIIQSKSILSGLLSTLSQSGNIFKDWN